MVFVVERYLPGLNRSELLGGLLRLEQGSEKTEYRTEVRYLGSTIVLRDEACYCQFEGPTSGAVAEANRQAGLPFDRIVPALTVKPERSTAMNASITIPATVQIKRGRLFGLIVGIAALVAAVTWVLSAYAFQNGSSTTAAATPAVQGYMSYLGQGPGGDATRTPSIMSLTPADIAANALGTGYALPSVQNGPSVASVLASLSPETRRYTQAIMNLTFAQLAAGAAGQP